MLVRIFIFSGLYWSGQKGRSIVESRSTMGQYKIVITWQIAPVIASYKQTEYYIWDESNPCYQL